jgi:hypothetical protein
MDEDVAMKAFLLYKTGLKSDNRIPVRRNLLTDAVEDANVIGGSNPGDHDTNDALTGSVR